MRPVLRIIIDLLQDEQGALQTQAGMQGQANVTHINAACFTGRDLLLDMLAKQAAEGPKIDVADGRLANMPGMRNPMADKRILPNGG